MREFVQRLGYILDVASGVWTRPSYRGIPYSDGDEVEQRIASAIGEASDISVLSPELRQHCTDWASLYHLSASRANIMRPFRRALHADVLEIGAGCGAITRYLGECGGNVLALEGSPRRAAIARARTRDLRNVTVVAETFAEFQGNYGFDVVTLIGVLEYAGLFVPGQEPQLAMLERARSLLKPGGTLIVAIENQLGLKYFAGAPEDHLGQPMYGLESRYQTGQPQTFGRAVLAATLKELGFLAIEFLSPLPDYKLPISILTGEGFRCEGFDSGAFAWQSARRDPQIPTLLSFAPELVWPPVFANRLALDLANSFLIVASPSCHELVEPGVLAYHYSTERKPEFCKETVFRRQKGGEIRIEYNRLDSADDGLGGSRLVRFVCPSSDAYSFGKPLSLGFVQLVTRDEWSIDEVARFLTRYVEILAAIAEQRGVHLELASPYSLVPGALFDAVAQNLIVRSDGSVSLIDQEWELCTPIELGHLLFRTLLQLIGLVTRFGRNGHGQPMTRGQFVAKVLQAARLGLTATDYDRYLKIEEQITEEVIGRSAAEAVKWWPELPLPTLSLSQAVVERDVELASVRQALSARDEQIKKLGQTTDERDAQISCLTRELKEVEVRIESIGRALDERDARIESIGRIVAERNARIESIGRELAERDATIAELGRTIENLNCRVAESQRTRAEQLSHLATLNQTLDEREREVGRLDQQVCERDNRLHALDRLLADREKRLADLQSLVSALEAQNSELLTSNSWRMTKPLRSLRRSMISRPYGRLRKLVSDSSRSIWHSLPASNKSKQRLKNAVFCNFPSVFGWSKAYQSWKSFRQSNGSSSPQLDACAIPPASDEVSSEYVGLLDAPPPRDLPATVIAFYLPQFHAIAENDAWWGPGFTEWSNVKPAKAQFEGHYQPHVPGELGYYDLLIPPIFRRQIELAKLYGVGGFCFYFYWFGGKTLLERPLENYMADPSLSLPFCICWANENWSRRWDGLDDDVLIAQRYSAEDDLAFIEHVGRFMRDPRYVRVGGKPLLIVYRPSELPSATETVGRWRTWCGAHGIGEILLAYTQSFECHDPARYGFDAAIEFPPNNSAPPDVTRNVRPLGPDFACTVYDWNVFVERSQRYDDPGYRLFRTVCPSWDNTARRRNRATVFLNANPARYRMWVENAIEDTCQRFQTHSERLIFVNAWNEWAEGAHLEPDRRYGYAWLQATRDALEATLDRRVGRIRRVLVVTHDAYPHGAQYLALRVVQELSRSMSCEIEVVCLGDGPLKSDLARCARLHELAGVDPQGRAAHELAAALYRRGFRHAILNTTVCGLLLSTLKQSGMQCIALVHELPELIRTNRLEAHAKQLAACADKIVFPAAVVRDAFSQFATIEPSKVVVRPQGLYKRNPFVGDVSENPRRLLRGELGIPHTARIVLAVGYADQRKGVGSFVDIARTVIRCDSRVHFVWLGHWDEATQSLIDGLRADPFGTHENIHFIGRRDDTSIYYAGADLFALTSREDPFPSVALEAMEVGLPIVAFAGSGGVDDLVREGVVVSVPMGDTKAFAERALGILSNPTEADRMSRRGQSMIGERFSFRDYLFDILSLLAVPLAKISVIVPNYNYARYIPERLASVLAQTHPVYEILFLDDASTDDSVALAGKLLAAGGVDYRVIVNDANSGSPFLQWMRGATSARGEFVWIAEADDVSSPDFLETVVRGFDDPRVALSYCESKQIDQEGLVLADNYLEYLADLGNERWRYQYVNDGCDEICRYLAVKNTIPNVSAVLFRRADLVRVLTEHLDDIRRYRIAGDWKTYLYLLAGSWLAFFPQPLNLHRRHQQGVTISSFDATQLNEIEDVQDWVARTYPCNGEARQAAEQYSRRLSREFGVSADRTTRYA